MTCPSCSQKLKIAERKGIEIDYCPSCRGVWLDRGELDKIIERSAEELSGPREQPGHAGYGKHGGEHGAKHGYGYKHRRRWGVLREIFDIFD